MTAECVSGGNVNECADTTLENHALLKVWIAENDAKGRNFQDILESNYPKSGKRTMILTKKHAVVRWPHVVEKNAPMRIYPLVMD